MIHKRTREENVCRAFFTMKFSIENLRKKTAVCQVAFSMEKKIHMNAMTGMITNKMNIIGIYNPWDMRCKNVLHLLSPKMGLVYFIPIWCQRIFFLSLLVSFQILCIKIQMIVVPVFISCYSVSICIYPICIMVKWNEIFINFILLYTSMKKQKKKRISKENVKDFFQRQTYFYRLIYDCEWIMYSGVKRKKDSFHCTHVHEEIYT